jgi:hypothetical protein
VDANFYDTDTHEELWLSGVALVAAAVCVGCTATHGVMALRLFDESVSATRSEPQR